MARPRRSYNEYFYDQFSEMPLRDQEIALAICNELHRQAKREKPAQQKSELQVVVPNGAKAADVPLKPENLEIDDSDVPF